MFIRWIGLTASILMCVYAASFVFDGNPTTANEWLRQILTLLMAMLLLFWSLIGIWSRPSSIKFTRWTYRMAIKKALDCEFRAYADFQEGNTPTSTLFMSAIKRRRKIEARLERERGRKHVRHTS